MSEMNQKSFRYVPDGKVLKEFFWSDAPVQIIQGPIGSGTSTACCMKLWRLAMEQAPDENGRRKTRWLIVRNTYSELKETTLKTWKYWFEEEALGSMGEVKMTNPPHHDISWPMPDGTFVQAEFIFLALDQEEDVRKLLSLEVTGIWFNEVQFSEKEIFDTAHSRAMQGRYPPKKDGGPTWRGIIADLNAPPEGHWIPYMRGDLPIPDEWDEDKRQAYRLPSDWRFFMQPAGLIEEIEEGRVVGYKPNPLAENQKWLTGTYLEMIGGKTKQWIDTFIMNRVGMYRAGQPVYSGFENDVHVAKKQIEYNPLLPLIIGLDFARNPAMVVTQLLRGGLLVLDEFGVENENATTYAPLFRQRLMKKFPEAFGIDTSGMAFWGDPTGDSRGQGTDKTPFSIFKANGMTVFPAPGNNSVSLRINAVQSQINKMVDGRPGILLSPSCITLKAGFNGGYHFAKIKGTSAYQDEPNKRVRYADFHDALQYACIGAGLGNQVIAGNAPTVPTKARKKGYSLRKRRA